MWKSLLEFYEKHYIEIFDDFNLYQTLIIKEYSKILLL